MTDIKIVPNRTIKEEIEEIGLPNFDIMIYEEESWFDEMIKEIEQIVREDERKRSLDN